MNVKERLSRIRFLTIKPDLSGLSANELLALKSSVRAARKISDVFLDQMGIGNRALYERLSSGGPADRELFELMRVYGSPWDENDNDFPFVPGTGSRPPGAGVYHPDVTPEVWQRLLAAAPPEKRELLESPVTTIQFDGCDLVATPYSDAYREHLEEAGEHLRTAAALLPRGPLEQFLRMRADAFRSNDYDPSDRVWIGTDGTPFEVTIGPYEVYFDRIAGLKASFEAFIGIPDRQANEALAKFGPAVPEVDAQLAERYGFKPSGGARPLEVISDVFRGGDAAFGTMFVAYNLPNSRRIRTEVGSKSVFSATMMRAAFDHLTGTVAERFLSAEDLARCNFKFRLLHVLGHELAHGIGPSTVIVEGKPVPFEQVMGPLHSAIEEAKADMLGMVLLKHFAAKGLVSSDEVAAAVITQLPGFVSRWRQGFNKAHAQGNLMQYNWFVSHGAVSYDRSAGVFRIEPDKSLAAMEALAHEFIALQASGDRSKAEAFVAQWAQVPEEAAELIARVADLPSKIHPIYDI